MTSIDDFQYVFKYLKYSDLINFSDVNKYLRTVTKIYLNSNFEKKIVLQCCESTNFGYCNKIVLANFQLILKFIRIFGDQFKILIFWVIDARKCHILGIYLNNYCQNLESLLFRSLKFDLGSIFMINLKNIFFEFGELHSNFCQLSKFFPKLEKLFLFQLKVDSMVNFNKKHQYLDYVVVHDLEKFSQFLSMQTNIKILCLNKWQNYLIERQKYFD